MGEALPFQTSTFDAVVTTLVLCSVTDVDQVVQEISRVLKPGGRWLFMEHVHAETPLLGFAQDLFEPLEERLAAGCHLNRDIGNRILAHTGEGNGCHFSRVESFERFSAMGDHGASEGGRGLRSQAAEASARPNGG